MVHRSHTASLPIFHLIGLLYISSVMVVYKLVLCLIGLVQGVVAVCFTGCLRYITLAMKVLSRHRTGDKGRIPSDTETDSRNGSAIHMKCYPRFRLMQSHSLHNIYYVERVQVFFMANDVAEDKKLSVFLSDIGADITMSWLLHMQW